MKAMMKMAWTALAVLVLIGLTAPAFADNDERRRSIDTDGDGYISPTEFEKSRISRFVEFSELDADADGRLTLTEMQKFRSDRQRSKRTKETDDV